jgi:hypothetical protein
MNEKHGYFRITLSEEIFFLLSASFSYFLPLSLYNISNVTNSLIKISLKVFMYVRFI